MSLTLEQILHAESNPSSVNSGLTPSSLIFRASELSRELLTTPDLNDSFNLARFSASMSKLFLSDFFSTVAIVDYRAKGSKSLFHRKVDFRIVAKVDYRAKVGNFRGIPTN
jgi:hypothetical protein